MIASLLVANRGEIARRIIRTARRLGIRTVAVHSDVDAAMPFVREADVSVPIGPAAARDSYLRGDRIIAAARETGAEAIHPGYGFLSENADFADAVMEAGLVWVGAPPAAIRAMGLKDAAKRLMQAAGVATTPGYLGEDQSPERLAAEAAAIGYPVLVKAVAGGGGKGMRRVDDAAGFMAALESCRREAASAFGDHRVLIEKYVTDPRHIEVQLFGDRHGNVVHLFERDCSLQRRHQKVIEEAPAPGMDPDTRAALTAMAVRAARAVDYVGAGTVEFIADGSDGLRADRIWFMEMNTRLQVEHPVTEAITGQDLVEWQLRVASGEPLPRTQDQLAIDGWAMEARLYAEDPAANFLPSIGRLDRFRLPSTVRVDAGVEEGNAIGPDYDPMIAKLIAHAPTREVAAATLAGAVAEVAVWPVRTNAAFLARTLRHPAFRAGAIDTGFLAEHGAALVPPVDPDEAMLRRAAHAALGPAAAGPWGTLTGFRLNAPPASVVVPLVCEGRLHAVDLGPDPARAAGRDDAPSWRGGWLVEGGGRSLLFTPPTVDFHAGGGGGASDGAVRAPMPGRIVAVAVAEGDRVVAGQTLVVVEAMKMEQALPAPFAGTVAALPAMPTVQVGEGALLARITPD